MQVGQHTSCKNLISYFLLSYIFFAVLLLCHKRNTCQRKWKDVWRWKTFLSLMLWPQNLLEEVTFGDISVFHSQKDELDDVWALKHLKMRSYFKLLFLCPLCICMCACICESTCKLTLWHEVNDSCELANVGARN